MAGVRRFPDREGVLPVIQRRCYDGGVSKSLPAALLRFGISWGLVALGVLVVALILRYGAGGHPTDTGLILFGVVTGLIIAMTAPKN
jgi:hypothetical protein